MTEQQEVVITKKKSKEQLWKEILEKAREALGKNAEIKKKLIQKTAEVLEEKEMPLAMICSAITREFKEFASGQYIRECLNDKYKNPKMKREQQHEEIAQVSSANDDKNVIEHKSTLTNDIIHEEPTTTVTAVQPQIESIEQPAEATETEIEEEETFQIRPEDYIIDELPKYPSELKDRIIVYLDEVRKLREFKLEMEGRT
jgi:hypothetical protein